VADCLLRRPPAQFLRGGIHPRHAAVGVGHEHGVTDGLQRRFQVLHQCAKVELITLPRRDILEVDRQAIGRRIDAVLEPAIVRRIVRLEELGFAGRERALVRLVKALPDPFGELGPDVPADELLWSTAEDLGRPGVDVCVDPLTIERDDRIRDALEDHQKFVADARSGSRDIG
jgi:hypothetical protein